MLRTRLIVGLVMAGLAAGVLLVDRWLHPWYPFLFLAVLGLTVLGTRELLDLLPPEHRPARWLCTLGAVLVVVANWPAFILDAFELIKLSPWFFVLGAFVIAVMAAFLLEMARFHKPGGAVLRIALLVWIVAYIALLPSFFVQLRWPPVSLGHEAAAVFAAINQGTVALAMAVFVPKGADVGAYLTGRFLGRNRMTPVLSPKKTWEGFAGGLAFAVFTAVVFNWAFGPLLLGGELAAVGFGLTVGLAGVLGDLAESLIKRDCQRKDASHTIPGFGGVLDLIDSVIFAAPVAYCWLRFFSVPPGVGS